MFELNNLYKEMQSEMLHNLNLSATFTDHPGTKGDSTESNWIGWLNEYLPKRYAVDKGIVIDSTGNQSEQIDIIIYDKQYSYFVFHKDENILIPAESVYAIFEIKQNLNKKHMEYAGNKAQSVRKLYRTSAEIKHAGGKFPPKELHEIISGILTSSCDWKSPITSNVAKYIHGKEYSNRLDIVCSISDGTYVVQNKTFVNENDEGKSHNIIYCDQEYSLVYFFLHLLKKLQDIGTVPAIDILKYAEKIPSYTNLTF